MSDIVERVAKAIFATAVGSGQWDHEWWREEQEGCLRSARAAIEAMREPTALMIDRGHIVSLQLPQAVALADRPAFIWQAMIDAALCPPRGGASGK